MHNLILSNFWVFGCFLMIKIYFVHNKDKGNSFCLLSPIVNLRSMKLHCYKGGKIKSGSLPCIFTQHIY